MKNENSEQDQSTKAIFPTARRQGADSVCRTVSVEEAGRILGISRGAAYTHARDGSLPTIRLGKRLLVPKAALDKMLMSA